LDIGSTSPPDAGARAAPAGRSWATLVLWLGLIAVVTAALWLLRPALDKAHLAMAYLLLVLGASARHGRRLGLTLAVVGFLTFNFFLLPPYYTFVVADPFDWVVLLAFLATGAVAAQLFERARREADAARQRAEEIERLSTLGAETLNAPGAEEAVEAICDVLHDALRVEICEIKLWIPEEQALRRIALASAPGAPATTSDDLFRYVVEHRAVTVERTDGTTHLAGPASEGLAELLTGLTGARAIMLPLLVRGRAVGVLRFSGREALQLDAARVRFAAVLSYYAALAVERVRLAEQEARAEALRETDRVKDALLASVSHDLRTPLTTIKALAHELRAGGDDRAVTIEREADRLNRLVADLLDLSRIRAGALTMRVAINSAEDLVGATLNAVAGLPGAPQIVVDLAADAGLLAGRFDFMHALRALTNLLENALRHRGGAPVELQVRRSADRLLFRVLDRGPGVPPQDSERIFEPFYKAPGSTGGGAGLGLAIARSAAEAQGGAVTVAGRPGGGSVFTLDLPAAEVSEFSELA
jgi:two-component system sensor histidine kinase KdpD